MPGELGFTDWHRWDNRKNIPGLDRPGVYFIAHSTEKPSHYRVNCESIVYIGETNQNLKKRLDKFNCSAILGTNGHSGGHSFKRELGEIPEDNIWVSICPVDMGDHPYTAAYIKYLERRLLWEFVCTWGVYPICNKS